MFKTTATSLTAPSEPITRSDLEEIIEGWKEKFRKITEGMRAIEQATEEVHAHMDMVTRDNHARDTEQATASNRIKQIQEGLARFIERCDPAHPTPARPFATPYAPKMSTPITPSGVPSRYRPDFPFTSPVNQAAPTEPTHRSRVHDLSQRPTHEDEQGNNGDTQHPPINNSSGMNNSASRPSSSPKVPIFDGTMSAQFRPWIIQFEAIARHQCWTMGERVVRLVASLTGPAANMLFGMTMGQLDDYAFREEAHRAELHARTRHRNEMADEFAENLKNLAQRAYTNADQNMLDNLVVERFREGHGNVELKKHLCLYPSTGLQDLIGACVCFKTHVKLGTRAYKSNEGLYTVKGNDSAYLTLDEVTRAARRLGYALRPWVERQQGNRGFGRQDNNGGPSRYQNGGSPQQGPKFNQNGNSGVRTQNPIRGRYRLERRNAGHAVRRVITRRTARLMAQSLPLHQKWSG